MLEHNDQEFAKLMSKMYPLRGKDMPVKAGAVNEPDTDNYPVKITPEAAQAFVDWQFHVGHDLEAALEFGGGEFEDKYPELYNVWARAEAMVQMAQEQLMQLETAIRTVAQYYSHEA